MFDRLLLATFLEGVLYAIDLAHPALPLSDALVLRSTIFVCASVCRTR